QVRELAFAEETVDVGQDDRRAAGSAEERHCGSFHAGRGRRRQLQAEPAQVRGRLCRGRQWPCGDAGSWFANHRAADARAAAACLCCNNERSSFAGREHVMSLSEINQKTAGAVKKPTVFVDGGSGTTGLGIAERLKLQIDIAVKNIAEEKRKDPAAKRALM